MLILVTMINKKGILEAFDFLKGKKVMLHANYEAFGKVEGGPMTVVEAFIELTELILIPTFNFHEWTEKGKWDQDETPSERGVISEAARQMIPRTHHPIYSFAVYSDNDHLFEKYKRARNSVATQVMGSPFAFFYEDDGLIVSVGYDSLNDISASVQYAELKADAPYRRIKEFHGVYKGSVARPALRSFAMFVRKPGVVMAIDPAVDEMKRQGIVQAMVIAPWREDPVHLNVINMRHYCDEIEWYVKNEPEKLHRVEGE